MTSRRVITRTTSIVCMILVFILEVATAAAAGTPGMVPSADGTPIAYEVYGSGGPTLILVHGWSCDARYWREQLDSFPARHRVVTVDLAGHGHSGTGRENYTMRAFGEDVRAVADAVGGDRLILVGHSMGGLVIAEAARLLPGRVLGLIGVDTLHKLDYPITDEYAAGMIAPLEADFAPACRQFAASMIRPDTDAELAEWIQADMSSAPKSVALSAMHGYMGQWISGRGIEVFAGLTLPVVGIYADLWPVDTEANRQYIHSFEAIVLEGTDHFLMLGAADEFNRALEKAIKTIAP
ncbi:MAG: alpha/beta hydrolase [bacterium]|nr:alpha/beta hydrolase [bacterium]